MDAADHESSARSGRSRGGAARHGIPAGLHRPLRAAALVGGLVAIAAAGLLLGLRLAGPQDHETALGRIEAEVRLSARGELDLFIPIVDWGVKAPLFEAPFALRLEPRVVERTALLESAGGEREVVEALTADLEQAARNTAIRGFLWGLLGVCLVSGMALLLALATGRYRARLAVLLGAAPLGLAIVFAAACLVSASRSFDVGRMEEATYYARGGELRRLLGILGRTASVERAYKNQIQRTIASYSALLSGVSRLPETSVGQLAEHRMLLLSDLHGNVSALAAISSAVPRPRGEWRSPAVIVGDLANVGDRREAARIAGAVTKLAAPGRQVIAVSGNHDSAQMMRALAVRGVVVLGRRGRLESGGWDEKPVQRILGRKAAAWDDPLQWRGGNPDSQDRAFSYSELPDGTSEKAAHLDQLVEWFSSLPDRPEILLIHDVSAAIHLASVLQARGEATTPLLILTGHDHRQHIERYGDILVVDSGTAGAGGLLGAGSTDVSFAELGLRRGEVIPARVDMISIEPISGRAQAQRVVPGSPQACADGYISCHP